MDPMLSLIDRIRFFIEDHPWGVTGTLLALLAAAVIGWAVTSGDPQDRDLERQLAAARHRAASLRDRLEKRTAQGGESIDRAGTVGAHAERKATGERTSRTARAQGEQGLDQRAESPSEREQGSAPARETPKATPIPDGTWQYGRDYGAGTYRAPGGEGCYWSTLRDANPRHIIDYDVSVKRPAVELGPDTPFFKTVHCGKWVKAG